MEHIENLYLYRTARDDGMNFCVGATFTDRKVNGMYALFASYKAAETFLDAMRVEHGVTVFELPSVEAHRE